MRPDSLLRLAVVVSALLFLLGCPHQAPGSAGSEANDRTPALHNFVSDDPEPAEKPVRIRPPRPHSMKPQRVPPFRNNSRSYTAWHHTLQ